MTKFLVSWIGEHCSTVDGNVIQMVQTLEFEHEDQARAAVVALGTNLACSQVKLWSLVERFDYRYDGTRTEVTL